MRWIQLYRIFHSSQFIYDIFPLCPWLQKMADIRFQVHLNNEDFCCCICRFAKNQCFRFVSHPESFLQSSCANIELYCSPFLGRSPLKGEFPNCKGYTHLNELSPMSVFIVFAVKGMRRHCSQGIFTFFKKQEWTTF